MVTQWVVEDVPNAHSVGQLLRRLQHTKINVSLVCKAIHELCACMHVFPMSNDQLRCQICRFGLAYQGRVVNVISNCTFCLTRVSYIFTLISVYQRCLQERSLWQKVLDVPYWPIQRCRWKRQLQEMSQGLQNVRQRPNKCDSMWYV